ncbi:MAG: hypothetical protein M0D55_18150 [Elusimicrobiota bacterium]|nr:MAG: hypothetical protein M0D55_18150 [Elusimicrobiota bacterium]
MVMSTRAPAKDFSLPKQRSEKRNLTVRRAGSAPCLTSPGRGGPYFAESEPRAENEREPQP